MSTLKEQLAQKIDSIEKLRQVAGYRADEDLGYNSLPNPTASGVISMHDSYSDFYGEKGGAWWLMREMMRQDHGVYNPPTAVLLWLQGHGLARQYFPHISTTDKTKIAFTPDMQSGQADRQVTTTIGRFLRKFCIVMSDAWIAKMESSHVAELSDEFFEAKTADEIEEVYRNMAGDSGCMRYQRSQFYLKDYHPSAVYAAPGISVAYLKNANGEVSARSVVYVNPDDPTDKRYVRIYGAPQLKSKLERQGYRMAGLAGARLAALRDKSFGPSGVRGREYDEATRQELFVMPYLDQPGGNTSGLKTHNTVAMVYEPTTNRIRLLDKEEYDRYSAAGVRMSMDCRGTSGFARIPAVDESTLTYTCALSGETVSRLEHPSVRVFVDGETRDCKGALVAGGYRALLSLGENGRTEYVYVRIAELESVSMSKYGHGSWLNTERNRNHCGIVTLSSAFYPDGGYASSSEVVTATIDGESHVLKRDDALRVRHQNCTEAWAHISALPTLKKAGYISVAVFSDTPRAVVHKDHPNLERTRSGRHVLSGISNVARLTDGSLEFSRNVDSTTMFGRTIRFHRDDGVFGIKPMGAKFWRDFLSMDERLANYGLEQVENDFLRNLRSGTLPVRGFEVEHDGHVSITTTWSTGSHDGRVRAAREFATWTDEQFEAEGVNAEGARWWASHARDLIEAFEDFIREAKYGEAEARALDYTPTEGQGTAAAYEAVFADTHARLREILAETDHLLAVAA